MKTDDPDYKWLIASYDPSAALRSRRHLADRMSRALADRIATGQLPFTIGVFGGWGAGKTTFLAMLADALQSVTDARLVYFNAWKYAGFMEIVPALIYKIIKYGVEATPEQRQEAAKKILLSLGKDYAEKFGDWAQQQIGINPAAVFRDAHRVVQTVQGQNIGADLLDAYYTQVDKAQDELSEILGGVIAGRRPKNPVIVLIDELDRCDPNEAFTVIKQVRVLFAMRNLPVAFVMCANPEPIGLAIKHQYGLESDSADYEARRILEKFVDAYEDLSEATSVGSIIDAMWRGTSDALPWIVRVDKANGPRPDSTDVLLNATALDAITTAVPLYSNIRVLKKTYDYVSVRAPAITHFIWTAWHLAIAAQIDPSFRRDISVLAGQLQASARGSYQQMAEIPFHTEGRRLVYGTSKGFTLFAIFRTCFWIEAKSQLAALSGAVDPEEVDQRRRLAALLANPRRMDFIVCLSLLPFGDAPSYQQLAGAGSGSLPKLAPEYAHFGWLLVNG